MGPTETLMVVHSVRHDGATSTTRSRLRWDARRKVHYPLLAIQFVVCVGCWVLVVLALGGSVSGEGLTASGVTGGVLVGVTWALAKCGVPPPGR